MNKEQRLRQGGEPGPEQIAPLQVRQLVRQEGGQFTLAAAPQQGRGKDQHGRNAAHQDRAAVILREQQPWQAAQAEPGAEHRVSLDHALIRKGCRGARESPARAPLPHQLASEQGGAGHPENEPAGRGWGDGERGR